jgi:MFS family permease
MQNEEGISSRSIRTILTRDFILGFLALFAFLTAFFALIPTLPIFLARSGSKEAEIGVLVGAFGASSLVCRLLVGGILVRYSERRVMMVGALLFGLTFFALMVFRPFWPFFVVRILQGVSFACVDTAALAFVINITPLAYRGRAIGYFVLAPPFSQAIAPVFGLFLINHYDFIVLFLACGGLCLCSFFFSHRLKRRGSAVPDAGASPRSTLFLERKIIVPAIPSFLQGFVWGALMAFFPLYALERGVTNPGLYFSAVAVMLITARTLGGGILDTYSKEKILLMSMFTSMVAVVTLSLSGTLVMFVVVGLLWGTGSAFFFPASMAYALEYAGSSGGTAVGTFRALSDLGVTLGPIIMGIILPLTGYRTMFLSLALIFLINLCYFQFCVRRKKAERGI